MPKITEIKPTRVYKEVQTAYDRGFRIVSAQGGTRSGKTYDGTFQLVNASWHVNAQYETTLRTFDVMEVVVDERTNSAAATRALGIEVGDFVSFEPRFRITDSGYIKSRFLDDKASAAVLLALAKMIADENIQLKRSIWISFTVYEEVGHGACHGIPEGIREMMSVDMGCVGETMTCTEKQAGLLRVQTIIHYILWYIKRNYPK